MEKKDEKRFKIAKENALAEFQKMVEYFGFNVSMEATKRVVSMDINNIPMQVQQDVVDTDAMVQKIMQGIISFDEDAGEIVYQLKKEIKTGQNNEFSTKEFRFGQFTRAKQKATKIPLNQCNFSTLKDEDQDTLLMAMTGISDESILGKITTAQFNDLRMIASYFFN